MAGLGFRCSTDVGTYSTSLDTYGRRLITPSDTSVSNCRACTAMERLWPELMRSAASGIAAIMVVGVPCSRVLRLARHRAFNTSNTADTALRPNFLYTYNNEMTEATTRRLKLASYRQRKKNATKSTWQKTAYSTATYAGHAQCLHTSS